MNINYQLENLRKIYKEAEEIAGQWNGDKPGIQEDNAQVALEIMEKCEELRHLMEELT